MKISAPRSVEQVPQRAKWIFTIGGIINSSIGVSQLVQPDVIATWGLLQVLTLVVAGPMMLVYGVILLTEKGNG